MWKDEYEKAADIALNVINYPKTNDLYKKINEVESEYEEGKTKFDKKEVIDYLNEKLNLHLPYKFMDIWLENKAQNIIAVAKHFPWHGATKGDSHFMLPRIKYVWINNI